MRALVKSKPEVGLWMEDIPKPTIGPNDLLIKIQKTAICGTDVHIFNWDEWAQKTIPVPLVTGHEFIGIVEEVGSHANGFSVGDRVSGEGHITCGHCRNCRAGKRHLCRNTQGIGVHRPGCFAEYLALPAGNAFLMPHDIPDELGAIFDPFGNATHTALSFDLVGEDVLITGAGPIGIMAVAICKHVGARLVVVTDINDYRLQLAQKIGATRTVNPLREDLHTVMHKLGMQEGFDVALEMSGNAQAFETILDVINYGGHIAMLGIIPKRAAIDWSMFVFKGLTLKGIYGREMFETWYKMKSMLQSGLNIEAVLTHKLPIESFKRFQNHALW
jgi:threonine 3-dehydrogenase